MGVFCTKDLHFGPFYSGTDGAVGTNDFGIPSSLHWSARDGDFVSSPKMSFALSSRSRVMKSPREKSKRTYRRGFLRSTEIWIVFLFESHMGNAFGRAVVGEDERRLECLRAYHPTGNGLLGLRGVGCAFFIIIVWVVEGSPLCS